jgi:energy-coupling factor transporter ATP-binding protein EcfA2
MALATVRHVTFSYPGAPQPALRDVSFALERGEVILVLGPSGSGKSTLLRSLAGLVPHFHGGRFSGSVEVAGRDTRSCRPAQLAGTVATLFQDPEDQVVMARVENEVAFGLENVGVSPGEIEPRVAGALATVGALHLAERRVAELSAGELQRVCAAAALALDPELLLLDEPTSQLDPGTAEDLLELVAGRGCAVVLSEQRPSRPLEFADRVFFLESSRLLLDAPREEALAWLAEHRPDFLPREPLHVDASSSGEILCALKSVSFAYGDRPAIVEGSVELRRGEIVALAGPNGSGKTTLAKLAAGLLEPQAGSVRRVGRAAYLSQDPGRYLACNRALEEVALGVGGNHGRARDALAAVGLAGLEDRHPRDLSSGERERLALAAVLVVQPEVLVLDEPTRGVDPRRKDELAALLRRAAADRATLVVTHDLVFAAEVADRVVSLATKQEPALA